MKDPWYLRCIEEIRDDPVNYKSWRVTDGLVYKQRVDPLLGPMTREEDTWKLVVPVEYRNHVLRDAHCEMTAGHLGVKKTYERIAQEYYWPGFGTTSISSYRDVTSVKLTWRAPSR